MTKRRRVVRTLLIAALLIASTAVACWFFWDSRSTSGLRAALERYAAAGLPTTPEAVQPPAVQPDENGAPLYLRVIEGAEALEQIDFPLLLESSPEVRRAVEEGAPQLALLEEAARREHCVFPHRIDLDTEPVAVGKLVPAVRLLAARAVLRARDGEVDAASRDLHTLARTADAVGQDPLLISQVVRMAFADIFLRALEKIYTLESTAPRELRDVLIPEVRGATARGLRGEAASLIGFLGRDDGIDFSEVFGNLEKSRWSHLLTPIMRPYMVSEMSAIVDGCRRRIEVAEKPYAEAVPGVNAVESDPSLQGGILPRLLVIRTAGLMEREAQLASRTALARLAARCIEYRHEHGNYPETLQALGGAVPLSPLSQKPFLLVTEDGATHLEDISGTLRWRLPS